MSGTFYNMPSIPCKNRTGAFPQGNKQTICNKLNPDEIYNSLYPCDSDPMSGFDQHQKKELTGSSIDSLLSQTPATCATACNDNDKCTGFSIENVPNTCEMYKTKEYVNSERYNIDSIDNKISIYQYNKSSSKDCGDGCITDAMQSFTEASPPRAPKEWDNKSKGKTISRPGLTLDDCKRACIAEKGDYNSIVYTERDNKCNLYSSTSSKKNNPEYDTYIKDPSKCKNTLGLNMPNSSEYHSYYKDYKEGGDSYKGAVGDYFCKYDPNVEQCLKVSQQTCTPNSPYCTGQYKPKPTPKPPAPSGPTPCLPPLCNPHTGKPSKKKHKGIRINDHVFEKCQKDKDGKNKEFCIDDIYTFDDLGLPVSQSSSNPPSQNYLYMKDYDIKGGATILSCPKSFKPVDAVYQQDLDTTTTTGDFNGEYLCKGKDSEKNDTICVPVGQPKSKQYNSCPPNKHQIDVKKAFKTKIECISWCKNNPSCVGMTSSYDSKGGLLCNFYKKMPKKNKVSLIGSQIYTKRADPYVYSPDPSKLKKFQVPSVPPGSTQESQAYNLGLYTSDGKCGNNGCCADGITASIDDKGSNCIEFSPDSHLIGSPKQYFKQTSLGGTTETVPIDIYSGSSYMDRGEVVQESFQSSLNSNKNYITTQYIYIISLFLVIVMLYLLSKGR